MSNNPVNLVVRFILELIILGVFAWWGWKRGDGLTRYGLAIGLPLLMAFLWGAFRVAGDHGKGLFFVPGPARLLLELVLFATAAYFCFDLKAGKWAWIFVAASVIHYAVSYVRVIWLLKN